jgi:hypothetical protein
MYALAASAAGVGMLALAQPAEAKIVYTKTHHVIRANSKFNLDLNHDGITDLTFKNNFTRTCTTYGSCRSLVASLAQANQAVYNSYGAVAMKAGMQIGPKDAFLGGLLNMVYKGPNTSAEWGNWVNVNNRYLGVKFQIKGETHYGWARLSVQVQRLEITAILTGYAYETIPGKGIIAGATNGPDDAEPAASLSPHNPEPATLGVLAMGAPGLSIWKREEP